MKCTTVKSILQIKDGADGDGDTLLASLFPEALAHGLNFFEYSWFFSSVYETKLES